jgi:glycerophosphoryl diester phosphodiesterase
MRQGPPTLPFPAHAVIAHRGYVTAGAPENTLEAFIAAIAAGADAIELDVQRLADSTLVIFHDDEIAGQPVGQLTHEQLQRAAPDRRIPSFEEFAQALRGRTRLDVELKAAGVARDVIDTLARRGWGLHEFAITSFDSTMLSDARRCEPGVKIGLLTEHEAVAMGLARAKALGADFLAPDDAAMNDDALRHAIEAKMPLLPWVVNDIPRLRRWLAHGGVAGVITDALPLALTARRNPA